jgi:hypothetical protein
MEPNIWGDFLMKQAPVIIVLGLGIYFLYKYFVSQIKSKDEIIKEKDALLIATIKEKDELLISTMKAKDEKIDHQTKAVMELYGRAVEAQNRNSDVCEQLLEVLKETRDEIREVKQKIAA